ncbi:2174_t:CDS:2 [Gigaspora margarita]|uniref:2174_t:CDS:1 n=1 Tax=Gigaspora margarita TaxID=4874 RepID=A0ABN7W9P8_GIGMA|nr:2174_t:CDS:2 [Gigaspora margarita]
MGSVISTLKVKKQSIKRLTFNNKNKLLIKPFEEDYDSEDSIDRLSVEDFNKEDEDQDHEVYIIHSDDIEELSEEQLKIRKEFEEADKHIPDIAMNAYKNMHPNTVWKSQYLKLPKLPGKIIR